jgi:predicted transcriptional regulator
MYAYLRRLEAQGYVRSSREGRTSVYSARVQPKTVIRETIDDLIDRLFAGETLPLMRHLIEDRGINEDEIAAMQALLKRLEEGEQ